MIEKLKQLWKIVEENRNFSEDDFVYEKDDFGGTNNESVLIGIDKNNFRGILVKDKTGLSPLPKLSSYFDISRIKIPEGKFIKIICKDTSLNEIFIFFTSRLIDFISDGSTPTMATKEAINEVKKMIRGGGPLPPENEIIGLLGELLFVEQITKTNPSLWEGWYGQDKKIKDFSYGNLDVEIKSSSYSGEETITINNLKQLELIPDKSLFLVHFIFNSNPLGKYSVPYLVDKISSQVDDKEGFKERISQSKYKEDDREKWSEKKYDLTKSSLYEVNDSFPRINRQSFKNSKIPESISKITYELSLNSVIGFKVDIEKIFQLLK